MTTRSVPPTYVDSTVTPASIPSVRLNPAKVSEHSEKVRAGYAPFDLFQWLTPEAQRAFAAASRQRCIFTNGRIYTQSERGDEMFRIVSGTVRMSVLREDGREALHSVLQPGDCFGICSMLDEAPRHHTTTANGAVELQVLRREGCVQLRSQHASFADALFRHMSRHTRLLIDYFVSSTIDELSCRVALRLLKGQKPNAANGRRNCLMVNLSQSELALMVGASRQAVNKVLKQFEDQGVISIEYGRMQVLDVDRLQALI